MLLRRGLKNTFLSVEAEEGGEDNADGADVASEPEASRQEENEAAGPKQKVDDDARSRDGGGSPAAVKSRGEADSEADGEADGEAEGKAGDAKVKDAVADVATTSLDDPANEEGGEEEGGAGHATLPVSADSGVVENGGGLGDSGDKGDNGMDTQKSAEVEGSAWTDGKEGKDGNPTAADSEGSKECDRGEEREAAAE